MAVGGQNVSLWFGGGDFEVGDLLVISERTCRNWIWTRESRIEDLAELKQIEAGLKRLKGTWNLGF